MRLYGEDLIAALDDEEHRPLKLVINESAAYLFPTSVQHQDASQAGLCYRDDSEGNALAATIKAGRIDIRSHAAFSEERVRSVMRQFLSLPKIQAVADQFQVFYHGQALG